MVEITESGVEQILLVVKTFKDNKTETPTVGWDYPDLPNAYFLIGVLESIKLELLDEIDKQSKEKLGEE